MMMMRLFDWSLWWRWWRWWVEWMCIRQMKFFLTWMV